MCWHGQNTCRTSAAPLNPFNRRPPPPNRQAQLSELRQAQRTWELERQQLLSEVEEERQRLQDGLSQALSQASCARREADAAAERATHWCTLAELLQRSALLSGSSPASPASLGSLGGASPAAGSASKPPPSMLRSASRGCGLGSAASTGTHLAPGGGDWCSPASVPQLRRRPTTADRYAGVGAGADSLSASEDGPGLIAAFQAVAGAAAGSPGNAQALGSPVPNLCPSSAAVGGSEAAAAAAAARDVDEGHCAASGGVVGLAASADLAPGSHLSLLKRLPAPGLSASLASSSGEGSMPLTPALCAAAPGVSQGALGPFVCSLGSTGVCCSCVPHPID